MEDGSTPLKNSRHERFALLIAKGEASAAEAYRQVISSKCSQATAETTGPKMARDSQVALRIAWIRSQAEEKAKEIAGEAVLSIAEKRLFCARLVRAKVGTLDSKSELWNSIKVTQDGTEYKLPDKLRAIALDNDLAGDGSEANKEIIVIIGGNAEGHH